MADESVIELEGTEADPLIAVPIDGATSSKPDETIPAKGDQSADPSPATPAGEDKSNLQKRFDEKTASEWALKRENADQKAQIDALTRDKEAQTLPLTTQATGAINRDDYVSDEEYISALVTDGVSKGLAQGQQQQQAVQEQQTAEQRKQTTLKKLGEGGAKIEKERGLKPGTFTEMTYHTPFPYTPGMLRGLESLDDPAPVALYLAENPNEGFELSNMHDPVQIASKMGEIKILARMTSTKKPEPNLITGAPEPLPATKGGGGGGLSLDALADMEQGEFNKKMREIRINRGTTP